MLQAILFLKSHWNINDVKKYLERIRLDYISYRTTKKYYRMRIANPDYSKYKYKIVRKYMGNPYIDYIIGYRK